jgi:hypothetical protein
MNIKIGADELILWLRKNNKAKNIPNSGTGGLGIIIYNIINKYHGKKINDNNPSYWSTDINNSHIGEHELPQTSAQYSIDINNLPKIFTELDSLN